VDLLVRVPGLVRLVRIWSDWVQRLCRVAAWRDVRVAAGLLRCRRHVSDLPANRVREFSTPRQADQPPRGPAPVVGSLDGGVPQGLAGSKRRGRA
jgi:hypothetical protein